MTVPTIGSLALVPALERPELLADPVRELVETVGVADAFVAPIDPDAADTAALVEAYHVPLDVSANCVVVAGTRAGEQRVAACLVLATTRADVNRTVRHRLNARKASFLPMDDAVGRTGMEYGGITPVGLPEDWPVLIDPAVAALPWAVIGSGLRASKLVLPGSALAALPGAEVLEGLGV